MADPPKNARPPFESIDEKHPLPGGFLLVCPKTTEKTAVCGGKARRHSKPRHPSHGWYFVVPQRWTHVFNNSVVSPFGLSLGRCSFPIQVSLNFVFIMISFDSHLPIVLPTSVLVKKAVFPTAFFAKQRGGEKSVLPLTVEFQRNT